jgi:predicted ATPase
MVLEDAHWIDPTSRELIEMTVERVPNLPVLLIITYRPEFRLPWTGQAHVTTLRLNRLGPQDSSVLVEHVAGAKSLPAEIIAQIVERTDGVPLFVEELTKTVLESGMVDERNRRLSPLSIPASLQASLMARLDRLAPARQVAQIGAAIGRQFSHELALAVSRLPEVELQEALDRLVASELIFRRGTPPRAEYIFKHALVQDVAYSTMLRQRRQELHTRIAHALEERGDAEPEVLAHHFTEAHAFDRAVDCWLKAGRSAAQRSANAEAIVHLTKGIETIGALSDTPERARRELELQLALGPALLATRGWNTPEANSAYGRAQELSRQLDDDRNHFLAVWGSWLCGAGKGAWGATRDIVAELFRIADRTGNPEFLLEAHHAAWGTTTFLGEFAAAHDHVTHGLALYDFNAHRSHALLYGGHDPGVCGKALGAVGLWLIGYPEQAAQSAREGIALAESLEHAPTLAHALAFAALCHQLRRDPAAVFDCGECLAVLGSEHGLAQYRAVGTITRGWALAHQGQAAKGLAELLKGLDEYGETRVQAWLVYFKATLAEVYECAGDAELGLAALDDALALSDQLGERFWQAGMLHRRGTMLLSLSRDRRQEAEHCYQKSLEISTQQQARSIRLRAATSLAQLWRREDRGRDARDLLAQQHSWFTEGFDTPDLKQAKAVLDTLA